LTIPRHVDRATVAYHRPVRGIERAEILSIGSEITVGETRDTNAGELAALLTAAGVEVRRVTALPDELPAVRAALESALADVDLVVSTGGLGPTPDDLTRESIAAAIGETPVVDSELEAWLRDLFARRKVPFPAANMKQAWLTPSATPIPNANGTAPGWWVDRPDGRVVVALPGPPREMRPMWRDWVSPRLAARGLGLRTASVTLRTSGLGESLIADRLGSLLDRGANPTVATYARADAVDVRISATPTMGQDAASLVAEAEAAVLARIGDHVWARGDTSWPAAIEAALRRRRWRLATLEIGTRGSVAALLAEGLDNRLVRGSILPEPPRVSGERFDLARAAEALRAGSGAAVVLAVRATARGGDMGVTVAVVEPGGTHVERRLAFLGGAMGRSRAALLAAAILHRRIR
jgi:nicotinamide-nucleotide amidase